MFSFVLSSTAQLYQSWKIVSIRSASMLTIAYNLGYLMTVVIQLMKTKVCYCYECTKKKIITYLYTCWLCLLFLYKLHLDIGYFFSDSSDFTALGKTIKAGNNNK